MLEFLDDLASVFSLVSNAADNIAWKDDSAVYWTEDQSMDDCRFIPMDDDDD